MSNKGKSAIGFPIYYPYFCKVELHRERMETSKIDQEPVKKVVTHKPYYELGEFLREIFPEFKVQKISIHAGFTCPNRDGTLGTDGCIFCSGDGGGEFAAKDCGNITLQLEYARKRVEQKCKSGKYIIVK